MLQVKVWIFWDRAQTSRANTGPAGSHSDSAQPNLGVCALDKRPRHTMPSTLKLNAVAFISPQNHPILIRTFAKSDENAIKYHYIAHTSLDIIEERGPF